MTAYYDSTLPSRIETWLNSDEVVPSEEIRQAKQHIDFIVSNYLTKYNHQPIYTPEIGRPGKKKVLLIDQRRNDYSVIRGCADENTFDAMLRCAIRENPDADILIKTHPDTLAGLDGYYTKVQKTGNIFPITFGINPISLIKAVDHVYVVSSQFGFEAAMCGKKVSVFGLPFYSGWGLTDDRLSCSRRQKKRTLEEIFAFAYMRYTHYSDPDTKKPCDIQRAMDWLLENRREYFKASNIRCDI
jgi:capsular polysaccharide export protein